MPATLPGPGRRNTLCQAHLPAYSQLGMPVREDCPRHGREGQEEERRNAGLLLELLQTGWAGSCVWKEGGLL